MSEGFTKGPWESEGRTVYKLSPCNIGGIGGMANHFYLSVQRGHKDGGSQSELEANAHLIAAAPLLYDELSSAPEPNEIDVTNPERFKRIYREWFEASSKALAKARGELK